MPRKAHVYRVYQTDDKDNITDPDTWVDVLRIDRCVFSEPRGSPDGENYINRTYVILWGDNTVAMGPSPPAPQRRVYEPLTITEPAGQGLDPTDPSLAQVVIPLIKHTWFDFRGSEQGFAAQAVQWVFRNFVEKDGGTSGRKMTPLRVTNNDLNGKDQDFFPDVNVGDPASQTPPEKQTSWDDYVTALQAGNIDDSQYLDVLATDRFNIRFPPAPLDAVAGGAGTLFGQKITYVLVNLQQGNGPVGVEDLFKAPPSGSGDATPTNTPGGLWRTDPFQAIVNVSWRGLAVEFGDGAGAPP
jgi:hypothetical protein